MFTNSKECIMAESAIRVENLTIDFGSVKALDGISLDVPAGIIFGFLGPNGAGKTTTIRSLLGLLEPASGSVLVSGYDTRTQADQVRLNTGALLEHTGIYEQMRAFQIPTVDRQARIHELLTHMGLWERRKDRAGDWSRGMKQKLALARTLLHRPSLVLLDEPTAGLDVQAALAICDDLQALADRENVTIFLTTHNMAEAEKLCHQVAIIREGRLVAQGSPQELKVRSALPRVEITGSGFSKDALDALLAHPQVYAVNSQNDQLVIDLNADADAAPFVRILVTAGASVEEVRHSSASLEEVFVSLMGESHV
jgi:ABC-2 type transport system ATP-binding protein